MLYIDSLGFDTPGGRGYYFIWMKRKRIDIYTIDIGGGHIAPAQAIKQAFDLRGDPDLDWRRRSRILAGGALVGKRRQDAHVHLVA